MISPSKTNYCENVCPCSAGGTDVYTIKRHDTCPALEVEVRGKSNEPVDLTGWVATATLFYLRKTWAAAEAVDTTIYLDSTKSVNIDDVLRAETLDAPRELILVTGIDRDADSVTVTRGHSGTTAVALPDELTIVGVKASDIPVDIVMETYDQAAADYYQVSAGDPSPTTIIASTKLVIKWRSTDTANVGDYYVQVELTNADTDQRMTLPRASVGFPVRIGQDANDT